MVERFLGLFPNRFNSLIRRVDSDSWRSVSRFHSLSDDEILAVLASNSRNIRACSFDTKTRFAVIGIGVESQYNNPLSYAQLKVALNALGLKPKPYKASDSDDIHVYVFFNESVDSELLHAVLTEALEKLGFSDKSVQVYPSEYQLPLPLQAGFSWLDDKLHVIVERNSLSRQDALTRFIHDIDDNAVAPDKVLEGTATLVVKAENLSADRVDQICIEATEIDSPEQATDDVLLEEQVEAAEQMIISIESPIDTGIDPSEGTQLSLFLGVQQVQTLLPTNRKQKANKKNISTTGRSPPISDT